MLDPLTDIENRKGQEDIGRFVLNVYRGAKAESDNWIDAFWTTVAYCVALFKNTEPEG